MNNPEFEKFISLAGSQVEAARLVGCSEAAISNIRHGKNGMSKKTVNAIIKHFPNLSALSLLYPEDTAA